MIAPQCSQLDYFDHLQQSQYTAKCYCVVQTLVWEKSTVNHCVKKSRSQTKLIGIYWMRTFKRISVFFSFFKWDTEMYTLVWFLFYFNTIIVIVIIICWSLCTMVLFQVHMCKYTQLLRMHIYFNFDTKNRYACAVKNFTIGLYSMIIYFKNDFGWVWTRYKRQFWFFFLLSFT